MRTMDVTKLPWVNEAATARAHPLIFHYTRDATLELILQSGGLAATRLDSALLNDPNELKGARDTLVGLMKMVAMPLLRYAKEIGTFTPPDDWDLDDVTLDEARKFHDIMISALPFVPYISCFCAHDADHQRKNGLLTMWRLYGHSEGIALGFDTAALVEETNKIIENAAVDLLYVEPILYGVEDSAELTKRLFEADDVIQKFADNLVLMLQKKTEGLQFAPMSLSKFLVLICGTKLPDFSDEREIRLIVGEAFERVRRGRLPPDRVGSDRIVVKYLDALRYVMVGPCDGQEAVAARVRQTLDRFGFQRVEVLRSGTQLRFVRTEGA